MVPLYDATDEYRRLLAATDRLESAMLVGPRGCGLSSVMRRFADGARRAHRVLELNLEKAHDPSDLAQQIADCADMESLRGALSTRLARALAVLAQGDTRGTALLLDHLDRIEAPFQEALLLAIRDMQRPDLRGCLLFVLAGSVNPQRLSDKINTSPVENRANRVQLPPLRFEEIDAIINAECARTQRRPGDLTEEVRCRLFDLAGDHLPLLLELVRELPSDLGDVSDLDQLMRQCETEVLDRSHEGHLLRDALKKTSDAQFAVLGRVFVGRGPRINASWYHEPERDAVDICAAGLVTRGPAGRLLFRNELVPTALVTDVELRNRMAGALDREPREIISGLRFHRAGSQSLRIAFRRCQAVEIAVRQLTAGLIFTGVSSEDMRLALGRIHSDERPSGELARFLEQELGPPGRDSFRRYVDLRKSSDGLATELGRRRSSEGEELTDQVVDLLHYTSLKEVAQLLDHLSQQRGGQAAPGLAKMAKLVEELARLRNRVAHHRGFSLADQRQLRTLEVEISDLISRV